MHLISSVSNLPKKELVLKDFKRVDEYDADEIKMNIIVLLQLISTLMGIKTEISKIDLTDIIKMLLKRFKHISFEEISIAFEMERYNEYDDKTEHYQLFNAEYVSLILNKYLKWKISYKRNHNLTKQIESKKVEFSEDEYKELIFTELQSGVTNKASIYFKPMAQMGLFKEIPLTEYYATIDRLTTKEIENLKATNTRYNRDRAKQLRENGADELVILKAKDVMISKILSKLTKDELFYLLKKCDKINQEFNQKNKFKTQEILQNVANKTSTATQR